MSETEVRKLWAGDLIQQTQFSLYPDPLRVTRVESMDIMSIRLYLEECTTGRHVQLAFREDMTVQLLSTSKDREQNDEGD